ncbi:MAG: GEVED domain-containing protein [Thermoanaerobaculia bacterium]
MAMRRGRNRHSCVFLRTAGVGLGLALLVGRAAFASGETVPLNSFSVPAGATLTVTFRVTVDSPLGVCSSAVSNQGQLQRAGFPNVPTDDPDVGGASDPTATALDVVDLAITKTDSVSTAVPGQSTTYTITASNSGPSPAVGATVSDTFPAALSGVTWSCVGAAGGTCPASGSGNISASVNLPVGGSVTFTATGTISPTATGTLSNTATVTKPASSTECNLANNSATDSDTLTPQADLSITKTNGVTSVNSGGTTTYTIAVSNSGPSTATGASVSDTFPAAISAVSWTCVGAGGGTCPASGSGNISASVTLPPSATVTFTAVATISGTATGTLSNTATVAAPGGTTDPVPGNNSATDGPDTIVPQADLSITKTDGVTTAVPGLTVVYTIVASNAGPATATGASVSDTFPATLTCTWTCVGAGGGSCTASGSGNIGDSANLPNGGSATYTATCTIANNATGSISNTASISGGGVVDTTPGNNSATDTDTLLALDFGDAPDTPLGPPWAYPTKLADNGARHGVLAGVRMGAQIDSESDGQPTANADGDDQISGPNVDDEDGVTLPSFLITCESASVTVNASVAGKLDAFVDFNRDGDFADAGEKIFNNQTLAAGVNNLSFTVPCGATVTSQTFARFRFSTAGGLSFNGVAADGEVEDYPVAIRGLDFGDAPDPGYPTLFASNGARHVVTGSGPILGSQIDAEANGQPNAGATGDDANGVDDEDGVVFTSPLIRGQNATVMVTASAAGVLNAWVDFNGDGSFAQAGDQIFTNQAVTAGANNLTFAVPAGATTNLATFSRFRITTASGTSFNGLAADGEVEDHAVSTAPVADLAITKTDGSATEVPGTPVTYTITASNLGPDTVMGATVADVFPPTISGVTWTCVGAGGGTCPASGSGNINSSVNLPASGSVTFTATGTIDPSATGTLSNTATVAAPTFDPNLANNSATDTDTLGPQADLSVTKTDGSATEVPGTTVTYTITVTSGGPSDVTGATVADTFPATITGVTWTCVGATGGTCPASGSGNINASVNLPTGSTVTFTATGNIAASATGTLSNTATVTAPGGVTDPTPANNSATDTDTLTPQADVAITKTDGSATEVPGTTVTYTITASNAGPSNAPAASVVDTFPATITGVTWTCVGAGGGTCPASGSGNINATVSLPSGGSVTFTATGTIASSATGSLSNTASVGAGAGVTDPTPGNNSATDTDTLTPQTDLSITKVDDADPPAPGAHLTYTITVQNLGPSDATGVTVTDNLPASVTLVQTVGCTQDPNGTPTCTLGAIAAGASKSYTIEVSINPAPPTSITNTASVTGNETDPVTSNNSDSETTTLDAIPPKVNLVNTVADTGDGALADCETANVSVSQLLITFNEHMATTGAADANNPANYLLVAAGPDRAFATTGCGAVGGDDVAIPIASASYSNVTDITTLDLGGSLGDSLYRLYACSSLTDLAGNHLDGDGNGTGGDDFLRRFRADSHNLFANGHFDCTNDGWTATASTAGEISHVGADAESSVESGSAQVVNLAPGIDTDFSLSQCVNLLATRDYDLGSRVRLAAGTGISITFKRTCELFSAPACSGSLASLPETFVLQDTGGVWLDLNKRLTVPVPAVSLRCSFAFRTATGESFTGNIDHLFLRPLVPLFADGFETGDTSAWALCVGTGCAP